MTGDWDVVGGEVVGVSGHSVGCLVRLVYPGAFERLIAPTC
jgi:hypothetical protein